MPKIARPRGIAVPSFAFIAANALAACVGTASPPAETGLKLAVAPLSLPGIDDACYDIRVTNDTQGNGDVVWSQGDSSVTRLGADQDVAPGPSRIANALSPADTNTICATRYGNATGGDIAYIGPCDADTSEGTLRNGHRMNSVTIWVDGIYRDPGSGLADMAEWQDPCPAGCTLDFECVENQDTLVEFNFTILRDANQGFFDVAVEFEDIFCSAKADCEYAPDRPIDLLHNPATDKRDQTVVLGLACTSGAGATNDTVLFRDPVVITCAGADPIVLDPTLGEGSIYGPVIADPDLTDPIWQYAIYSGDEDLDCGGLPCNKRYWNVAIGFDPTANGCTLTTTATASSGASMPGFTTPAAASYPLIEVDVDLTGPTGGLVCSQHPLNGPPAGVRTTYTTLLDPLAFCHRFDGAAFATGDAPDCAIGPTGCNLVVLDWYYRIGGTTLPMEGIDVILVGDGVGGETTIIAPECCTELGGTPFQMSATAFVCLSPEVDVRPVNTFNVTTMAGGLNPDLALVDLSGGKAMAIDSADNLYIADTDGHRVVKLTPDGIVTTLAGLKGVSGSEDGVGSDARFKGPGGIAVGGDGVVYVSDTLNGTIRKIALDGTVTTFVGKTGVRGWADAQGTEAVFYYPAGLAFAPNGDLIVAEYAGSRIRRVTMTGEVTTIAGATGPALITVAHDIYYWGHVDGEGTDARFKQPNDIATDSEGNIYVSEGYGVGGSSNVIRKVTPSGTVTTIAGAFGTDGPDDGIGSAARFSNPYGLAMGANGVLLVVDNSYGTIRAIAPDGTVTTVAGQGDDRSGINGIAQDARFNAPYDVVFDSAGAVIVLERRAVRRMDGNGVVTTIASSWDDGGLFDGVGSAARFSYPWGVATDFAGGVWIADNGNGALRRVASDGTVTTLRDSGGAAVDFGQGDITGVAATAAGDVYTVGYDQVVRHVATDGSVRILAGELDVDGVDDGLGSAARFNGPEGVALGPTGDLFVADTYSHTIRKVTPSGEVTTIAGQAGEEGFDDGPGFDARFSYPTGLAVDGAGVIWVVDANNYTIRRISAEGVVSTFVGTPGQSGHDDGVGPDATFGYNYGIAVDAWGYLWVVDYDGGTIRMVTPSGEVSTVAAQAPSAGFLDGTGAAARFAEPIGIAVDGDGVLYVGDYGNHAIRKIE